MNVGGLGSQAAADQKRAELAKERKQRDPAAVDNGKELKKLVQMLLKQDREMKAMRLEQQKQSKEQEKLLTEIQSWRETPAVEFKWQTRMTPREKSCRDALWIPLHVSPLTQSMIEAQFKVLAKAVHPDQNPGIGDGPFIALKEARDELLKICTQ